MPSYQPNHCWWLCFIVYSLIAVGISVLRVASGPRVKLASCKSALNSPPHLYFTGRSKAVLPVLVLLFVALWFIYEAIFFKSCLVLFVLVFFSPFSIAITSLGEERANLSAFRTSVRFALFFFCFLFLLVSGKGWHSLDFSFTSLEYIRSLTYF